MFGHVTDEFFANRQYSPFGPCCLPRFVRINLKRKVIEVEERVGAVPDGRVSPR